MDIEVRQGNIVDAATDLIVVNLFQGVTVPGGATGAVDRALRGAIREVIQGGDFAGKTGETSLLYTRGELPAPRVLIVGLGDPAKFDVATVRSAAATAARRARDLGVMRFATIVHGAGVGGLDVAAASTATVEGTRLGLYRFAGHKSPQVPKDWKQDPMTMTIIEMDGDRLAQVRMGAARGEAIAMGTALARDMVSEPANFMTPTAMAGIAARLAEETGLGYSVLERADMAELGMGILLAVASESEQPPKFIVLEHNPAAPRPISVSPDEPAGREDLPCVVLIGKGVTFDSGGISLKPGDDMWRMKGDMAGAAAVIASLGVAARLKLPLRVVGLAPCAENLPGGRAQKPGDVFTGMMGKTMEVVSTDAEGRMLLADALAYAARFDPDAVVDIATLTGAKTIALGTHTAALFANDEALAAKLLAASNASKERLWRMPLLDEYADAIKSPVADVKNSGGRHGGVGTSAKFLEHFTEGYRWAHIDMASMSISDDDRPAQPKGATGFGVRLITEFLEGWSGR